MTPPPVVDELATSVRSDPSGPNLVRLWEAVYGLEHWWLVPTGTAEDPRPLVGVVGEQRFLLAFTGRHHVAAFAGARPGADAAGATAAMTITPADLTGLAGTLAAGGIAGVLFDRGVHDLVAPIAGLQSMWTRFGAAA
ncbi:hypothetical protein GCM10017691_24980 [Pseudonocardia petroleophila]|uniref:SseB protein N-terminal domain-containing protein n=1 Tax=Pseudonocardia petroleophila TaxID=37331 RepID=A0A7G7MFK8_9PSEU|nr:hypothetical protein [Pseudonocardia petroleophila]QNG51569.1 hypothetical protein H6H00_26225 [Pseudonocardia petroleophila]